MTEGINLVPGDIRKGWRRKKLRKALIVAVAAYFLLLGGVLVQHRSALAAKMVEAARV